MRGGRRGGCGRRVGEMRWGWWRGVRADAGGAHARAGFGINSAGLSCEARFELLSLAWLRSLFCMRWAGLRGQNQATKHLKSGWTGLRGDFLGRIGLPNTPFFFYFTYRFISSSRITYVVLFGPIFSAGRVAFAQLSTASPRTTNSRLVFRLRCVARIVIHYRSFFLLP